MVVNNFEFEYFVDYINYRFHILDLSHFPQNGITNILDPDFQKKIIDQEHLLNDVMEFEWICYTVDGYVAMYKDYAFRIISPKIPYLHRPYLKIMQIRSKRNGSR